MQNEHAMYFTPDPPLAWVPTARVDLQSTLDYSDVWMNFIPSSAIQCERSGNYTFTNPYGVLTVMLLVQSVCLSRYCT